MSDNIDVNEALEQELQNDNDDGGDDSIPSLNIDAVVSSPPSASASNIDWLDTALDDTVVEASNVLVPKNKRGQFGSRDYLRNLALATEALDPKMGVPSHFVSTRDGETETGNQTRHEHIQEIFVSNIEKVEQARLRAEQYDMMDIFLVPSIRDKDAPKPSDMFNQDGKNMFVHWDSMSWKTVCLWQKAINKWAGDADRISNRWAQDFLYKSSTQDLRERVDSQYKALPAIYKGGVTYLFLMLKIMFHISRDTINALKKYLKLFEEKGLRRIRGENVVIAEKEINAVCSRLSEVNALPDETVVDVLTGLTNCSVPEFTKLFDYLLQGARVNALDMNGDLTGDDTLTQIKNIMSKAVDAYHALCTAGKWFVHSGRANVVICWNCGKEGHGCDDCKFPKNQEKIDENKKKFWENRDKPQQQQRKKWGENPENKQDNSGGSTDTPPTSVPEGVPDSSAGGANANAIMIDKDRIYAVFNHLERNTTNPETAEIAGALRDLLLG